MVSVFVPSMILKIMICLVAAFLDPSPVCVWFGFLAGELKSRVNLDRELTPHYQFFAQATDGGGRWCRAEVKLIISDVNDNPPIFTLSQYTTSVYEDTTPKALLTRIQAIDPDEGNIPKTVCVSPEL